jgi:methylphosphotriester-DNA--protein-cysteine methyltransferase
MILAGRDCDGPRGSIGYATAACARFPIERHEEMELNLVVAGSATVQAGSETYELTRGRLVWMLPGQWHGFTQASPDLALWVGMFSAGLIDTVRLLDRSLAEGRVSACVCLDDEEVRRLSAWCFTLMRCRQDTTRFNLELAGFLLSAWRARARSRADERDPHPAVTRAAALLTYSEDRWSLPTLSKRVGLSPFQLSRTFHAHMGVPLAHYANHQRVQLFEYLFGDGNRHNLLATALAAGFGSYSQFFRVFRLVTGRTPDVHDQLVRGAIPYRHEPTRERWAYPDDDARAVAGWTRTRRK